MNNDSQMNPCLRLCIQSPNGVELAVSIPCSEIKRILVSLGCRELLPARLVEMLLLCMRLEDA